MADGIKSRKLWSVSPSAIDSYDKCARSWYYGYVIGIRGPTPPHMAKGTSIHFAIEHYLKTGEVLVEHENNDAPGVKWPVMEFVQAAIPHLPPHLKENYWSPWLVKGDGGLMIEQPGEIGTYRDGDEAGPGMRQFIDLVEAYPDRATITDHKTTSDFRYCKTPHELAHNTQLLCNAKFLFTISDYKVVTLQHLYLLTKTKRPKAKPVSVEVTREHVEQQWNEVIIPKIRAMAAWAKLGPENADPLPPNTDHCNAYSGCQFKSNCGFESVNGLVTVRRSNMNEGERMSLLQDMMKRAGAAAKPVSGTVSTGGQTTTALVVPGAGTSAGTTTVGRVEPVAAKPAVTVVQAPAVSQAPVTVIQAPVTVIQSPAKPMSLLEKLAAAKKPPTVIENPVVVPAAAVPAAQVLTPEKAQEAAVAAGYDPNGIVPPDAPSRTSTAEEVAAANPVEKAIEEATEETTVEAVQITDAPAKRRRRTKAEMEAARAAEAAEAAGQAPGQVINLMETLKAATAPQAIPQAVETTNVTGQRFAEGTAEAIAHPERAVKELTEVKVYFTKEIEKALDIEPPVDAHAEDDEVTKIRKILTTPDQAFGCGVEVLFIDCLPGKGWPGEQPQDALDYVHAFNSLAASSAGVADYRLIRYESKGYLATAIKVYAKGLPKVLYVNSRMSGADVLLETIVPYVKLVYRGIL